MQKYVKYVKYLSLRAITPSGVDPPPWGVRVMSSFAHVSHILRGLASTHRKSSVCDVKFKTITQQTDFQTSIPYNVSQIF